MTHQCNECPNFTDGKCCHETKASSQFEVGKFVLYAKTYYTYEVVETATTNVLALKHSKTKRIYAMPHTSKLRLATPEEVAAGHRIDFNLYAKIERSNALQREVDAWKALGNKPTEAVSSDEVYARGRSKTMVAREAKKRKKPTFFFGCPKHGETRFCTVRRKCIACSGVVSNRSEGKDHA